MGLDGLSEHRMRARCGRRIYAEEPSPEFTHDLGQRVVHHGVVQQMNGTLEGLHVFHYKRIIELSAISLQTLGREV